LPVVVAAEDPSSAAPVGCLYLGLASGWLAAEVFRAGGWPASRARWRAKSLAGAAGVALNTALFVAMGLAAGATAAYLGAKVDRAPGTETAEALAGEPPVAPSS